MPPSRGGRTKTVSREPELERQLLHRHLVEVARVREDGELVARERPVREDVGEDVAKRAHIGESIGVRLFLVRHAHADPGDPDSLRPLSAARSRAGTELGERLAPLEPELVLASPLLRARETAAAIAKADGRRAARSTSGSRRARPPTTCSRRSKAPASTVVTVGHQPDCSEIAVALGAGDDPGFPTAGMVEVELS